jgi:ABC-type nitrate/sulfonate/bicarbonate transport system substrate-binding protein
MTFPRLRRAAFLAGTATAVAAPGIVRAADAISVGVPPGEITGPIYYAQELGMFKNAGLDVKVQYLASGPAIAAAITGGTIDLGGVNTGSLASARLRGVPLRAMAPTGIVGSGPVGDSFVVAKNSPIRTGADLNGKTVAVIALGTIQVASAQQWIDSHGGDSKTVKLVEMSLPTMAPSLESGRVDAAVFSEPFASQAIPNNRLLTPLYGELRKPFLLFAIVGTESWLQANAALATKFASVVRQANIWANAREHDKERRAFNMTLTKLEPHVIERMTLWQMGTTLEPAMIQPVIDVMVKYGYLERAVNPNDMIWRA